MYARLVSGKWIKVTLPATLIVALVALFGTVDLHAEGLKMADPVALLDEYPVSILGDVCGVGVSDPFASIDSAEVNCPFGDESSIQSIDITGDVAQVSARVGGQTEIRTYVRFGTRWNLFASAAEADWGYGELVLDRENEARREERAADAQASTLPVVADNASWDYAVSLETEAMAKAAGSVFDTGEASTSLAARSSAAVVFDDASAEWDEALRVAAVEASASESPISIVVSTDAGGYEDWLRITEAEAWGQESFAVGVSPSAVTVVKASSRVSDRSGFWNTDLRYADDAVGRDVSAHSSSGLPSFNWAVTGNDYAAYVTDMETQNSDR